MKFVFSDLDFDEQGRGLIRRLYTAGVVLGAVCLVGALGYQVIGGGAWSFADSLYMSIITLSTVGFAEVLPGMQDSTPARTWTVVLILLGSGTLLYFASTFTALIVEGDLRGAIRRRNMARALSSLENHVIVCGCGSTGIHVIEELIATGRPLVMIDHDQERIERVLQETERHDLLYVVGDATEDAVLEEARIDTAAGLIAALHEDRDNIFVTVTARALSDNLRIVAKAVENENITKLERVGADAVVAPAFIGGLRLAAEMERPLVLRFIDAMRADGDDPRVMEGIGVREGSRLVGRTLGDSGLLDLADIIVLAVRYPDGHHEYLPGRDLQLEPTMVLIVLIPKIAVGRVRSWSLTPAEG
ncbi:MAG: potassium channel protein [Myxococcota bacterium]